LFEDSQALPACPSLNGSVKTKTEDVYKSVPVPLCSPQIPHGLICDGRWACLVRGQPCHGHFKTKFIQIIQKNLVNILLGNMAEVVYSWLDCDTEIRLKVKCVTSDPKYKLIQSEIREDRGSVSESSILELKLDTDEPQELYTMCTRPSVKTFISQLITQLVTVSNEIPYCHESIPKEKRTWSDIVAGRNLQVPGTNSAVTQNIATVITSRPSHHCGLLCRAGVSEIVHPSMVKKNNRNRHIGRVMHAGLLVSCCINQITVLIPMDM